MSWYADFEHICRPDAPLAPLTWYKLGGPARWLFTPGSEAELAALVNRCHTAHVNWRVLGRGANILIPDAGVDAAVICLSHPAFKAASWEENQLTAGGGADFPTLVKQAVDQGLSGLEGLAGIPGTVGGIIRMNAGGKYAYVSAVTRAVRTMTREGTIQTLTAEQAGFRYRDSALGGQIVLGATFALTPGDADAIRTTFRNVWTEKSREQPPVSKRSAGCIFKNPAQMPAGKLIDDCGLKGASRGKAAISERHANFIVADPDARAQDVIDLIEHAKERVLAQHGIELELEIEIW